MRQTKPMKTSMRPSLLLILCVLLAAPQAAKAEIGMESVTVEGGPIASKHFQSGDENFRETHGLGIIKAHTKNYGNWGLYVLSPNSVDDQSIGAGYVTDAYTIPLGPTKLEFSAGIGLVTGYQDYPIPLIVGQARLVLLEKGSWDAGVSMAAIPYYMQDTSPGGDNEVGIVATSPFLSLRYNFGPKK